MNPREIIPPGVVEMMRGENSRELTRTLIRVMNGNRHPDRKITKAGQILRTAQNLRMMMTLDNPVLTEALVLETMMMTPKMIATEIVDHLRRKVMNQKLTNLPTHLRTRSEKIIPERMTQMMPASPWSLKIPSMKTR